jgi:Uma2 family endonuclease
MVTARQPEENPRMTEAEYLAFDASQPFKYEYSGGRVYAFAGGTAKHAVITMNVGTHINNQLGERNCSVASSDLRVQVRSQGAYRYPDVTVFCGEPAYHGEGEHTLTNPIWLVEVMSPESVARDQSDKLTEYTRIESLMAYLIVAQDKPQVMLYYRYTPETWSFEVVTGLDATLTVPVGADDAITLSLAQLYRRITWDEETDDETPPSSS